MSPWIFTGDDPRAVLVVAAVVFLFGLIGLPIMLPEGGFRAIGICVFVVLANIQLILAVRRWRRLQADADDTGSDGPR